MGGAADFYNIASGIAGIVNTGYNLFTNKRDYDYQKALQQEIFNREDTAVQRRVADLKAAGMNPSLAMGQSAGAGSVVARSNTNDVNFGSAIDYIAATMQAKGQKIANETATYERDIQNYEAQAAKWESALRKHRAMTEMGITTTPYVDHNGNPRLAINSHFAGENDSGLQESPVISEFNAKVLEWNWTDQKHSNELTALIQNGYNVITNQQKLYLEEIKSQFSMSQESINNLVANVCKMRGVENETTRVQNELAKLDWQKDKWTFEQICSLIVGLTNSLTF